jgi:hypothetical protein
MSIIRKVAVIVPALLGTAAAGAATYRWSAAQEEEKVRRAIIAAAPPVAATFGEALIAELPEVAQRYFRHAIAVGTPLATTVELEMRGTFLLGETAATAQAYAMTAHQTLAPTRSEFLWQPRMRRGAMLITGSDGLAGGEAWTRFWLAGLVPVVNEVSRERDLVRSAAFRSAAEAMWLPAAMLPQAGARWRAVGPDMAEVTLPSVGGPITNRLTIGKDGRVLEVIGQRWSNANRDKRFRLQPFGGTVMAERQFGGFTIPSRVSIGNHYGTPDFLPFFQAEITDARYR